MTRQDLDSIEQALSIRLSDEYIRTMLEYPFSDDSFAADCELPDEAERIISTNTYLRKNGFFGQDWKKSWFSFGGDGSGNEYYFDLDCNPSPVFFADHEDGSFTELSASFTDWLEDRKQEYAEWEEEDRLRAERRKNKKWWQFWI